MFNMDVGGIITGSPKMMAQSCNVILTVLPSVAEVREVAFGWEGLSRGFVRGGVLIDMGSSDPVATRKLAEELAGCGIDMVDAPALGTADDARIGKLTLVVGGPEAGRRAMPADLRGVGRTNFARRGGRLWPGGGGACRLPARGGDTRSDRGAADR